MNRRNFLRRGSLAGIAAAATTIGVASCHDGGKEESEKTASADSPTEFELNEATIEMLQQKMQSGVYSSAAITQLYLDRINAVDKNGPALNAVIEVNPDALSIAAQMDNERKAGKLRGPLHGIPVLIKDNIDTGDKMMTTAGSLALVGHKAATDAFVVKQLRAAGAVLLGKTNLSEWANFRSSRASSGWSSRGGQTKNPCVLNRNPCGSSSGSAAAVAANLCAIAVGTETDGSITAPSSFTGIVGIKPTVGLISRTGIIPISKTQDTAGPMARTVRDAAIMLGVLAGVDEKDAVTITFKKRSPKDYTVGLSVDALQGKKIGVEASFLKGHEGVVALYKQAIELIKSKGATVVEVELMKKCGALGDAEFEMMQYEFKDGLNRYLAASNAGVRSLGDVIAFNKKNEAKAMPYFKQELLESSEKKGTLNDKEYTTAVERSLGAREIIDAMMREHQLDAIIGTSIGLPNCIDLINGDYATGFYFAPPAAMAGYPHITVPIGTVHELPLGLSFISGAWSEEKLLGIAYAYEQASKKRVAPKFLATV